MAGGGGGIVVHTVQNLAGKLLAGDGGGAWRDSCTHSPLTLQANSWLGMVVVGLMYTQSSHLAGKLLAVDGGGGIVVHTVLPPSSQTPGWWWWWDCCTHSHLTWQANSWLGLGVVGLLYTQSSHQAGKLLAGGSGGGIVVHTVLLPGRKTPGWW
jgi:hypothetical protein